MRNISALFIFVCFFSSCRQKSAVHPSFYFWKTKYQQNKLEISYLERFKSKSLFVRIMDVDFNPDLQQAVPVSPINFLDPVPEALDIIPVVFIVNQVFTKLDATQRAAMAGRIATFVSAKVKQAGKSDFTALHIDCDWTRTTRDNYFDFLEHLKAHPLLRGKMLSVTLRLHQVKNIASSGIPPVEKAMLMCYNMGNLRKYGAQNSILDEQQMNLYLKDDLEHHPLKLDVALPIFEWAVVFRNQKYAGISRRVNKALLQDKKIFRQRAGNSILYDLLVDHPAAGLKVGDVVRWEEITREDLLTTSKFLSRHLKPEERNLVFYDLDADLLKHFTNDELKEVIANF